MVKKGDIFLAEGHPILSPFVNFIQKFWSKDDSSVYGHSGIIINDNGNTLEAKWKIESHEFLKKYKGKRVLVVRYIKLDDEKFKEVFNKELFPLIGQRYPISRLILHIFHLAKYIHWHKLVCSELVAKYLFLIGARHHHYFGTNVDDLEEELKNWKDYQIIFEGIL